ncbi:hypothetical protein [Paenibacillus taichungensis]
MEIVETKMLVFYDMYHNEVGSVGTFNNIPSLETLQEFVNGLSQEDIGSATYFKIEERYYLVKT